MGADENSSIYWQCIKYLEGVAKEALAGETCVVSVGGTTVGRQDEFLVREMPQSVTFSDRSTSAMGAGGARGCYRTEFNVAFETWAKRPTLEAACSLVLGWEQAVFVRVAADKTLGGLVVHAEPYVGNSGTSIDTNKTYTAAIDCGIRIKAEVDPAKLAGAGVATEDPESD